MSSVTLELERPSMPRSRKKAEAKSEQKQDAKPEAIPPVLPVVVPTDPYTTAKIRARLLRRAKDVANHRGIDVQDYLEQVLTPAIERDYQQVVREKAAELDE